MAPRGRHRKVGLTRMDAALDAMIPYGFSKELIRRTVKELLKVYGAEGWIFIEDGSYNLLIETILQKQDNCGEEKDALKDETSEDEVRGVYIAEPSATGSVSGTPENESFNPEIVNTDSHMDETGQDLLPQAEGDRTAWKDMDLGQHSSPERVDNAFRDNDGNSNSGINIENNLFQEKGEGHSLSAKGGEKAWNNRLPSPENVINSPFPMKNVPVRKRGPCHGWIGKDEDNDVFLELAPATLPEELKVLIAGTSMKREQRSRWDMRPNGT
ncbi:uncharacterized protein LOC131166994 isoform X2 [Malania oleifera]|uniref:uncharacterized protein LOC131166994 isoform X2 n=1 Tax=Malania oleifera TaxID=397392 RepID=UPI0025AE3A09|nr:uncharacterized protein LOC131166994 isoform X2 [Malania oleifera]